MVSFGLANDELLGGPAPFTDAFDIARDAGLLSTPHAGELDGPESIVAALELLGADRIQHGVRCVEQPGLLDRLADKGVCLDVCPTSNVSLSVFPSLEAHPLPQLLAAGVRVSINADDPLLFGPGLLEEYVLCRDAFGLGDLELARIAATVHRGQRRLPQHQGGGAQRHRRVARGGRGPESRTQPLVKPAPFTYLDPLTLDDVLLVLAEHGDDAAVISGGQSLVPLMNLRLARPEVVVDPRRVAGLADIVMGPDTVVVGAMVTASQLLEDAAVAAALPGLVQAVACIGHSQIRNRTTIGGSVAHADPAAELPAVLAGLEGEVVLASTGGERRLGAAELFDGAFSTTRRPDELVTSVRFPVPPGATAWDEIARRPGDFALAGLFASLLVDGGVVRHARLAFSGVSDRPVRATAAESALLDQPLDEAALDRCTDALLDELSPSDDVHASARHRGALAATLVRRVLPRLAA